MDILKLHREIQILDVHLVSILPELDGGRDVDTVSGEPVIRHQAELQFKVSTERNSPCIPPLPLVPGGEAQVEVGGDGAGHPVDTLRLHPRDGQLDIPGSNEVQRQHWQLF